MSGHQKSGSIMSRIYLLREMRRRKYWERNSRYCKVSMSYFLCLFTSLGRAGGDIQREGRERETMQWEIA